MSDPNHSGLPLPVGIVGCGGIAQIIHLPTLHDHPDVTIRALCDTDTTKAAVLADKYNIPRIYGDIAEMLKKEELELVFILTPNNLHLPMSLIALDHGVHLFIEKPAALSSGEAERIRHKAAEVGKTVMVGMQNRFRPDILWMKKFLMDRELGKVFFVKAGWLQATQHSIKQPWLLNRRVSGGGVVMDLGLQLIDMVWWLLDKPKAISVKAFSYQVKPDLPVEDFCVNCISFEGNISITLEVSWDYPFPKDHFYLEVTGEHGTGSLNPLKIQKIWHGQFLNITPDLPGSKIAYFRKGYQNEIHHYIDYLTGRISTLESSIEDAVEVLKIVESIYQSIEQSSEIKL